jgi:predicted phage-related endonuclease
MFTAEDAAKIGGSDLAAIMGLSQWSTPLAVYARVVSALEGRYRPDKADAYQSRGNIMERAVLEVYAERNSRILTCHGYAPRWMHWPSGTA